MAFETWLQTASPTVAIILACCGMDFVTIDVREEPVVGDVLEVEPPLASPRVELRNVLATPPVGASTEEAILAMGRAAIRGANEAELP